MRRPLLVLALALGAAPAALPSADALAISLPRAPITTAHSIRRVIPSYGDAGRAIVRTARQYLGFPYLIDGTSPGTGFSCIGFVSYIYHLHGIALPGGLDEALTYAPQVPRSRLMPGDVLYFADTAFPGVSHAALYLGKGRFIHSEWYGRGVVISSFSRDPVDYDYWESKYLTANRPWTLRPIVAQSSPTAATTDLWTSAVSSPLPSDLFRSPVAEPGTWLR